MVVEVLPRQIKMSAVLISLPRRSHVEAWYYFLALAFLDNLGVQNETTTSHNIVKKKFEVTFQVKKWSEIAFKAVLLLGACLCDQDWPSYNVEPLLFD